MTINETDENVNAPGAGASAEPGGDRPRPRAVSQARHPGGVLPDLVLVGRIHVV